MADERILNVEDNVKTRLQELPHRFTATLSLHRRCDCDHGSGRQQAAAISVQIARSNDLLVLIIRDNGRGITHQELHHSKSLGLLGLRERAMLLGGEFKISGAAGQGTVVEVRIPFVRSQVGKIAEPV